MSDLTIVYLTVNNLPEYWTQFHRKHLLEAVGDFPLVTVSRLPMDIGHNIIQESPYNYVNIYKQMLRVAKMIDTRYMAMAEDDVLYSKEHYRCFRPKRDEVAYNMARWSVFTWGDPIYSLRKRYGNFAMIGSRKVIIEALEERFEKWGDDWPTPHQGEIGRPIIEKGLQVTNRKAVEFFSEVPIINISHEYGCSDLDRNHRKTHAQVKAYDIPYWGKAKDIIKCFR